MTKDERKKKRAYDLQEYYRMQADNHDGCATPMVLFILLVVVLMLSSCTKTVYQPVPVYHEMHDTIVKKETVEKEVIKEVTVRDSVSFRTDDSIVYIERWHWERDYRYEKALQATIDSLSHIQRDSIPYMVEVEVVKEVPAKLTRWQGFLVTLGKISIIALTLWIVIIFVRLRS